MDVKLVKKVIDDIRPQIQLDGGDVELLGVNADAGVVKIKFKGACVGCPLSTVTLEAGISNALRKKVKGFTAVEATEDEPI